VIGKLCECGCGQLAPVPKFSQPSRGRIKGEPLRFVQGHNKLALARQGCDAPGCTEPHHTGGYCGMHAARLRRTGGLHGRLTPIEQLWRRVDLRGEGECWPWKGARQKEGYGRISTRLKPTASGTRLAHRAVYELICGPIPKGLVLDHLCRHPWCVNPLHLEPVTQKENTERGLHGVLRTHCLRDHELTPANTQIIRADNSRRCRECCRLKQAERMKDPVLRERQRAGTREWRKRQALAA
jgi:HNH endonuclease